LWLRRYVHDWSVLTRQPRRLGTDRFCLMSAVRMSYTDAAEEVLRRFGRGAPMHYRRITELAIENGLIEPGGTTPEASMNASINQEIKRRERQSEDQRFRALGRGIYGLATPVGPLGGAAEAKNREVKKKLRRLLSELDPQAFEVLAGELLIALGFEDVNVTKYSADGGIDVVADLVVGGITKVRTAIQVKRWSKNVPGRIVRELRGALGPHEQGLIITLSGFTSDARVEAAAENRTPISLVDGERLLDLLMENEIGASRRRISVYELDEAAFLQTDTPAEVPEVTGERPERLVLKTKKALSVWPLPGGKAAWKSTLDQMLQHVADAAPSVDEATSWLVGTFESASSEKVARGYWQVARSFGLIEPSGEHLALTVDGAEYLDDPTAARLFQIIDSHTAGFSEIVSLLGEAGSVTSQELLRHLRTELGVAWETDAQVKFRMGWLENLGIARPETGGWALVEALSPD